MSLPGRDARMGDGTEWSPPAEFHEYRILRPLGRGRNGRVFLAHDGLLERTVAVKFVSAESAGALTRLLNEARAAARVQHPNVVALFRVGQLKDHAYIISEYTRGTSLDRLQKPLPADRLFGTALDLARGLAAAHRAGVLHRDLKPSNAVLTEAGTVKLLDFGLAKVVAGPLENVPPGAERPMGPADLVAVDGLPVGRMSAVAMRALPGAGELVGTPYYMSPEAWRREEHTVRSDIYSLGAMLYEFAAGQAPFRHVSVGELSETVQRREPQPLAERVPGIDGGFAAAVDRCLRIDPLDRFPSAEALLDALEAARALPALSQVPEGNPYRGLRAFEAEHRSLFFGRRRDLRALRERLRSDAFVLLTGDSGVGKSSLAAAGLLPDVAEGGLADARSWSTVRLVPGHAPLLGLASAIAPALARDEQALEVGLRADPESFARSLRKKLKPEQGLLIYIDQLEELLTLSDPLEAERFITAITPLAEGVPGVKLVGSIRSDFLTRLGALPRFGLVAARAIYLVRPLEREELRHAVTGPARVTGVRFETEQMVEALVDAGGSSGGGLPLLQFALAELWDARDTDRQMITAESLAKLGGVAGALARHADAVIDALLPEQRTAARSLLLRLVTDDGTRARRTADELGGSDARYGAALEALVRGRLLVARESDAGNTFEVAHEALLSSWGRLAAWIAQEAETKQVRRRLSAAAQEWERRAHSPEALWGPQGVAEARVLPAEELAERERRFLEASQSGLLRARRRKLMLGAGTLAMVLLAAGAMRLQGAFSLRAHVRAELALAASAHQRAAALEAKESAARTEAFTAFDQGHSAQGERAWASVLSLRGEVERALNEVGDHLERAAALGSDRSEVRAALGSHLLERALRAEQAGRNDLRDLFAQRLVSVDADGSLLKQFHAPASLTVIAPGASRVTLAQYVQLEDGRLQEQPLEAALHGGLPTSLPPGSYLLTRLPEGTRLPVLLARGQSVEVRLLAPPPTPAGFVYVPEGESQFGTAADESVRQFLEAVPRHAVKLRPFFIARHETTWADYLQYLDALPESERARRLPHLSGGNSGAALSLSKGPDGWSLTIQPGTERLEATAGQKLHYAERSLHADVDWLKMPVSGLSADEARAYAAWLAATGRVPGARLCDEREWERAARGADGREYPAGEILLPGQANFDLTYGHALAAMGPDEVGSFPSSDSPFGVSDMAGNVWEWTTSVLEQGKVVIRGGSFFHDAGTCRLTNRGTVDLSYRNITVGIRMCATSLE